jgi:sulfoxide reductase heme-binding subunit YedZ
MRLSGRALLLLGAIVALIAIAATNQIVPPTTERQAALRIWLGARATGITAYLLLTFQVVVGLVLSHPTNLSSWRLSKRLFPWHEQLWVFVLAFLGVHIASIVLDSYANVGLLGAFVPGASAYRPAPVAVGTVALYALLVTGATARWTKLLPSGAWLQIHRLSLGVFALTWIHGMLAGTDSGALEPMYVATGLLVLGAAAYRHWVIRRNHRLPAMPIRSEVAS